MAGAMASTGGTHIGELSVVDSPMPRDKEDASIIS